MARELTQQQLEEMVVGKPGRPNVSFFDKPVLDRDASEKEGRRIYVDQVMVKKSFPDVRDWVAERAQPRDFQLYPEAYELYKRSRRGTTSPNISILPNLEPVHRQELIDYGLTTIETLVNAEVLPPHLQYAQDAAVIMYQALKEVSNGGEEKGQQEEGIQGQGAEAEDVPTENRREQRDHVGQHIISRVRASEGTRGSEGVHQGGLEHRNQGIDANFNFEVKYL